MAFLKLLFLISVNLYTSWANNNPLCPEARPKIGSVCSLPKGVGCKYRPYTCPETKTVFLSLCACTTKGTYVCAESKPPRCQCPLGKPKSLANNTRCTVGTRCRYDPVGCVDGIKFATNCECISTKNGRNTYLCRTTIINCESPNDADCPAERPGFEGSCDPTKVTLCMYDPYGCPGATDGEHYIFACTCETRSKEFNCIASYFPTNCALPTPPPINPCFSGDSLVTTGSNGEQVRLDKLQIGDHVLVDTDRFESVYSFGHRDPDRVVDYLEIATESSTTLRLSADHMIWSSGSFVPAWHLKVGDVLTDGPSGKPVAIVSIRNMRSKGAYAPFTPSGTIVVDGVLASSFVSLTADDGLEIAGGIELSTQWMSRMFEFPHRLVCHYLGSCPNEAYDEHGVSAWNAMPLRVAQWVLEHPNGMIRISLLSVFAGLLGVFWLLENPFVVVALVVGAMMLVIRRKAKTNV
ncbi:Hint module [Fragilaria crotonensis]|nr:Hint module [Fragilaria crotonensis]